jgi:hypothetical protein
MIHILRFIVILLVGALAAATCVLLLPGGTFDSKLLNTLPGAVIGGALGALVDWRGPYLIGVPFLSTYVFALVLALFQRAAMVSLASWHGPRARS